MIRPSWLIFSGRGRQARLTTMSRNAVHWLVAMIGFTLSIPIMLLTAVLIKLESKGPVFYKQERVGRTVNPLC
jgi:lipopolysaccharide/colanic/teichoic acid biosynthesis glycosyltransferase